MAILKLDLGEFDEIDYHLIAIHTSLEDYRLAYFINQKLLVKLSKSDNELQISIKEEAANFSRFLYSDEKNLIFWDLIQNKNKIIHIKEQKTNNLFSDVGIETATKVFLVPDFNKVDYFLKIEDNPIINLSEIQMSLKTIAGISTVYVVDVNQIKSKNNLIF